ncbi:hypothetical protein Mefer_0626 [Methanocaldococcus fervens AG86]|uniref:Uncharacterized protein n=1 Tax=Methanocaldococcus fervens (strain DSM 4213 / JCM 15782 / AG86) TaxID=573064 RepID=C7P7B4_METFA|nr:hypothetical protein Mefer_0626 [Methanocaldococcus fervens AG86]
MKLGRYLAVSKDFAPAMAKIIKNKKIIQRT